jgi:hypothetical protein
VVARPANWPRHSQDGASSVRRHGAPRRTLGRNPGSGGRRVVGRGTCNRNKQANKSSGFFNEYHQRVRGYHFLHTAIDGHSRLVYGDLLADER